MMVWLEQVEHYLERLDSVADELAKQVEQMTLDSRELRLDEVNTVSSEIAATLQQLQEQVAERENLLGHEDAPKQGFSLSEKLKRAGDDRSIALLRRCEEVSQTIADTNHQAISLFVCQYHLSDMTGELVRILAGGGGPTTYGEHDQRLPGGNLFNESA